jgi:hypothetical protein
VPVAEKEGQPDRSGRKDLDVIHAVISGFTYLKQCVEHVRWLMCEEKSMVILKMRYAKSEGRGEST